jgi:hypothetical protein
MKAPKGGDYLSIKWVRFVRFDESKLDYKGLGVSKAKLILDFLAGHIDRAFFSIEVAEALKDRGVRTSDVMSDIRRFERKGLVYVRGYRSHDRQTSFKEGYALTWINQDKPREEAIGEAVKRTDKALAGRSSTYPIIESIHRIQDMVLVGPTQLLLHQRGVEVPRV